MKAIVVVAPVFLRDAEDDQVDVVFPEATPEELEVMAKKVRTLLDDPREDVVTILFVQGAPTVEVVDAQKVRRVVGE